MIKVVIFDFDLTLYNSSSIQSLMNQRQWSSVYKEIPYCPFYNGAIEILKTLKEKGFYIAIVSNAPRNYIVKVLEYYDVYINYLICYHDVLKHKPHPQGIYQVLDYFKISNTETVYIGDNNIDYYTAKNANIKFFGVPWGTFDKQVNTIEYNTQFLYKLFQI